MSDKRSRYLKIYVGAGDKDIWEIWDSLPPQGKSTYVKDAIRAAANQREDDELTTAAIRQIIREEIASLGRVEILAERQSADEEDEEDMEAAAKILSMF